MKRLSRCVSLLCACLVSGATAQTPDGSAEEGVSEGTTALAPVRLLHMDQPGRIPGYYYVQFKSADAFSKISEVEVLRFNVLPGILPVSREDVESLAWTLSARVGGTEVSPFKGYFSGFSVHVDSEKEISKLADDPRIDFIEPVLRMKPAAQQTLPSNNSLWHLDRIDQRQLPLNLHYDYSTTATTVTVHVLDSGIRATHVEFANRPPIFVDHWFSPDTSIPTCTINFTNNPALMDCDGHGTRVASLIGGTTFGVAKQVRMRAYVGTRGATRSPLGIWFCPNPIIAGDANDMIATLNRAISASASDGTPSIINISAILDGASQAVDDLIQLAVSNGITVVVGAGNDTENACSNSPARHSTAITVAASNQLDQRWEGSNFGNCVDIFAPGENMAAASNASNTATITGGTAGTSLSTALVSGIAAMYLEDHENDNVAEVTAAVLQGATSNVLQGNLGCAAPPGGNCSPNRLAYSSLNGPPSGSLQFSASGFSRAENGTSATITVTRTVNSLGAVSASYATSSGSATAGSDYTAVSGTLNWASGDSATKSFTVPILDDSIYEGNETVNLSLSGPTGGAILGSPATATLTITDNESPPGTIRLSASTSTVAENAASVTISATRTGGSFGAVGVSYSTANGTATAGSDYTSTSGTLSWANGDTANKTFAVNITNDTAVESSETFTASISNPTGGATLGSPASATVTITDNDTPVPSVPTNLRTSPAGKAFGNGSHSVLWNASTGPVAYYALERSVADATFSPPSSTYTVNVPSTSRAMGTTSSGEYYYRVKACTSGNQCSAYSNIVLINVCNPTCISSASDL